MAQFLLILYQFLMILCQPLFLLFLHRRVKQGKEIKERLSERYGHSSLKRQSGRLVWLHGASVGETLALFPLIHGLHQQQKPFLVTTGTTAAALVLSQKFPNICHQFAPLDHPLWIQRFLNFWRPSIVIWTESEFWPTVLHQLKKRNIPVFLLNGGISKKSLKKWHYASCLLKSTLNCFTKVYSRSGEQTKRLKQAGLRTIEPLEGNIKFLADPLKTDPALLQQFQKMIGNRPVWLAASTHGGVSVTDSSEEMQILTVHHQLKQVIPNILTLIAPRHPYRRSQILENFSQKCTVACRSLNQPITVDTDIYLIDTLGELGTFFQISPVTFVGGSFVAIGGHNLLEPIQHSSVTVCGPYIYNAQEIFDVLDTPWILAPCLNDLYQKVYKLLTEPEFCIKTHQHLQQNMYNHQQQLSSIFRTIQTCIETTLND